jgi:hypothetical protein
MNSNTSTNNLVPSEFYLGQNYPNPFSERTAIKYCVAYKTNVKLEVFNAEGEMIKVLVDEEKEAGTYELEFNGTGTPEGFYSYQFQAGDFLNRMKMLKIK